NLSNSRGFTAVALFTLALGIGANIAIFTIVNAVLLHPLPFPEPERLVRIFDDMNGTGSKDVGLSVPELDDLRDRSGLFESVSGLVPLSAALRGNDRTERIELLVTYFDYFRLLGTGPAMGRVYGPPDAGPGFTEAVVISDGLWRRQFGADPHVLGRRVLVDEDAYTIAGVMPRGFRHPAQGLVADVEVWAAAGFKADPFPLPPSRAVRFVPEAIGRLKQGLTVPQAQQRLNAFVAELSRSYPTEYPAASRWSVRLESIEESWTASVRPMLEVLLAAVGFVLLVVAVNIASLLVARSSGRSREIAIRQALGASRPRLVRQLLTESVLLSLAGGMLAFVVLALANKSLLALMPSDLPRLNEVHFDGRVMALAFGLSLVTGILFGLTPAFEASACGPNEALKEGTRGGSPSARKNRFRGFLVTVEIALSVVLLSAAGLLLHSFWNSMQSNPGFNPNQLMVARIWIPFPNDPKANHYRTVPPIAAMSHEVLRRVREIPGVQEAAMGGNNSVPLVSNTRGQSPFSLPDEPDSSQKQRTAETTLVSPDYFRVLGIPLLRGRGFAEADTDKTKPVVVVSESFATQYLRKRDLGARIGFAASRGFEPRTLEIVGVVGDVHADGLDRLAAPRIYFALYQRPANEMAIFLRGAPNSNATKQAVRGAVEGVDLNLPVYGIRTMQEMMVNSLERRRFALTLMALFGALALFLASIGIYGVMAYAVGKRSQEFSIRMALGAEPRDILLLAFRPGVVLTCIGIAVGLLGGLGAARLMSSLLYGVAPYDPVTFGAVVAVLALVALAACGIPARRAIRIAPATALRS
ncbi:MAG TPA: ABC transporter permease, partial [Bryobacteraceae bacterium]|nr:ABC transporter permease [Bryobacteraceae bacterium]